MPYKDPIKRRKYQKNYRKKWYVKFKEKEQKRNKEYREKSRNWLKEYKKDIKCLRCPENHPACIEFHHINGEEKIDCVSSMIGRSFSIERIKKEIKKCIPLCANCHRKETWSK